MTSPAATIDKGCPSGLAPPSEGEPGDISAFVRSQGNTRTLKLSVRGAKCGGCLSKIEKSVNALPGMEHARLNLSTGLMDVQWSGPLNANRITEAISNLGYGVAPLGEATEQGAYKSEERQLLISMGVAGFAAANIMLLSVSIWGGHGEMGHDTRTALHALSGFIALPAVAYSGRHFFKSAWSVLTHGQANMDVPISLAILLAFGISVWVTITGGPHAYFDACAMLIFFLLIGRFLDARLRRRAYSAAHELAALQTTAVNRLGPDGKMESVMAERIETGDRLLLSAGERAAVDMRIQSGRSDVDESLVTGESLPHTVMPGSVIYAGTINLGAPLTGEALAPADNSMLAEVSRLMAAGEQRRSTYRKIADKAAALYVPFVHTTAALALLAWLLLGAGVEQAFMVAVTTLIITCPCALALAAPVAQVVASGKLFRKGIFLKSGDALERLSEVDHIVFDKTGTLSLGVPTLQNQDAIAPDILEKAATLARASRHPLSRAIVSAAGPGPLAADVSETPGLGLEAMIDGQRCRLGAADWTGAEGHVTQGPSLWFSIGASAPVLFTFKDIAQEGTAEAMQALRTRGYDLEIMSGDRAPAVEALARDVGVTDWRASASPADKANRLETLRAEGHRVLMVGDGLNDTGALSLAHAALAPGGAMDISQSASDAVYSSGPSAIPFILATARRTQAITRQNFGLAILYNLIAVPIAVTGHVTPIIAAIAMSASSLVVTANALRIEMGGKP